jgi:hypothetical protein
MFRRDVVVDLGGFDARLNAAEDQELYRRLVVARREARVVPETLLRYRRHEGQMTVAKSARVQESDAQSYERFVAALSPDAPARSLRLALFADPRFWEEPPSKTEILEPFFGAVCERLRLEGSDRDVLARAISRSAASSLLAGWFAGRYDRRATELSAFARTHGAAGPRSVAALEPLLAATAPAGRPVAAARSGLRRALRSAPMNGPRRLARRSRALRRLYARAVDTRSAND